MKGCLCAGAFGKAGSVSNGKMRQATGKCGSGRNDL